jgi:hypothetical protein
MDVETFDKLKFQPVFRVKANGIYEFEDFEAQHDRSFVRAVYVAILRRDPDREGENFYLQQLRSGYSKAKLLNTILRSAEAKKAHTVVRGLATQLLWIRACEFPVLGRLVAAVLFMVSINEHMRDLRALENHVIRLAEELQCTHESNLRKLRSALK